MAEWNIIFTIKLLYNHLIYNNLVSHNVNSSYIGQYISNYLYIFKIILTQSNSRTIPTNDISLIAKLSIEIYNAFINMQKKVFILIETHVVNFMDYYDYVSFDLESIDVWE